LAARSVAFGDLAKCVVRAELWLMDQELQVSGAPLAPDCLVRKLVNSINKMLEKRQIKPFANEMTLLKVLNEAILCCLPPRAKLKHSFFVRIRCGGVIITRAMNVFCAQHH
jgi:hypothetical protein